MNLNGTCSNTGCGFTGLEPMGKMFGRQVAEAKLKNAHTEHVKALLVDRIMDVRPGKTVDGLPTASVHAAYLGGPEHGVASVPESYVKTNLERELRNHQLTFEEKAE